MQIYNTPLCSSLPKAQRKHLYFNKLSIYSSSIQTQVCIATRNIVLAGRDVWPCHIS